MTYEFSIRREGRPDVDIPHDHETLLISEDEGVLAVEVAWCRSRVAKNRHAADAVLRGLWPGTDVLVMRKVSDLDPEAEDVEVFEGEVASVEYTGEHLVITAFQDVLPDMVLSVVSDSEVASGRGRLLTVDNDNRPAVVNWGDDSDPTLNQGNGFAQSAHEYATGGVYQITVTDASIPDRMATADVDVAGGAP